MSDNHDVKNSSNWKDGYCQIQRGTGLFFRDSLFPNLFQCCLIAVSGVSILSIRFEQTYGRCQWIESTNVLVRFLPKGILLF